jgi:hypothetical protein
MQIRDRVKQTATATSDTAYVLTAGVAEDGHRTFATAYEFPAAAVDATYSNVPVLVETAAGAWQIVICQLLRDDPSNAVTLQNGVVYASSTGSPLGLTGSAPVVVSVVPTEALFGQLAIKPRPVYDPPGTAGTDQDFGVTNYLTSHPMLKNGGLFALGPSSRATALESIALGIQANAWIEHSFVAGGFAAYSGAPGESAAGLGVANYASALATSALTARGAQVANTTDATPVNLDYSYGLHPNTTVDSGWMVNSGITRLVGTLSAYDTSGNSKVWAVDVTFQTSPDYSATVVLTQSFVELYEHASATGWTAAASADSGSNYGFIGVTGAAATNIAWGFIYEAHRHEVYP